MFECRPVAPLDQSVGRCAGCSCTASVTFRQQSLLEHLASAACNSISTSITLSMHQNLLSTSSLSILLSCRGALMC